MGDALFTDFLGYAAAGIVFLTFCMRTMLALRLIAIAGNLAFILYAVAADLTPILALHGALLPLNLLRLVQMRRQTRATLPQTLRATGDETFEWLAPYGQRRDLADGTWLFAKGDLAESLFVVVEGQLQVPDYGVVFGPGALIGEVGLFSPERRRTAGAVAVGPLAVSELTERRVKELHFDNPEFAYRLLRLITKRLVGNLEQVEKARAVPPPAAAG